MMDLTIFINTLINLNSKDELVIEKRNFYNSPEIKNIIKKYEFNAEKKIGFINLLVTY